MKAKKKTTKRVAKTWCCGICGEIVRGDLSIVAHGIMGCKLKKPLAVPKDLKSAVLKRFKTRDKKLAVVVARLTDETGYAVASLTNEVPTVLREFRFRDLNSELPESFSRMTQLELAKWYARHLAHHRMVVPSARKERSRRKRIVKQLVRQHQTHAATMSVVRAVQGRVVPPKPLHTKMKSTFIVVYDPKGGPHHPHQPTTFTVHTPVCDRLDGRRRMASKHDGDSWILESLTPEGAVKDQLDEFDMNQMGYDRSDFTIHRCVPEER